MLMERFSSLTTSVEYGKTLTTQLHKDIETGPLRSSMHCTILYRTWYDNVRFLAVSVWMGT